jgi:hypothetical protein
MTPESSDILECLIRDNDLGWMIDMYAPRDQAIPFLLEQLTKLSAEFRKRFQYEVSFAPETLRAEADLHPHKIRAFLQALGVSGSPDMLVMVWRILQGLSIREVVMNYREEKEFGLSVTLASSGEEKDQLETYRTNNIHDMALLRNFGITTVNGKPLFDGFLPQRKR